MKGVFEDVKDYKVNVVGDWRSLDGLPKKYKQTKKTKRIDICGGVGLYYFLKGMWEDSIRIHKEELEVVKLIEREDKKRFHKGWLYYQIAVSYLNMGDKNNYKKYLAGALKEDAISYGDKASEFPASEVLNEK